MKITDYKTGNIYGPDDPGYEKALISNLESVVRDLQAAIVDLQHRVSRLDHERLEWPGDTYEPTHTEPYIGVT